MKWQSGPPLVECYDRKRRDWEIRAVRDFEFLGSLNNGSYTPAEAVRGRTDTTSPHVFRGKADGKDQKYGFPVVGLTSCVRSLDAGAASSHLLLIT